ncbi:hypothetical protein [Sphingomonas sp. BK235]|uniref:hypothetical protein n=1 Tax=Sphingomonas sp. BK235 TaxID=2512131 RepID=UPI0010488418|nr:hypothetical protein [Sphingomonas sp. BK235]TCP30690.1 hypothetical protein EV292_11247 [Sphingomonas sp. BK235]
MSVVIPRQRIAGLTLRPVLFSGEQEGAFGGESLPIPRMGDRWAADVRTALLRQDQAGRDLVAALTQGLTDDGLISIDQPNRPAIALAGNAVVDGSNRGGTTLFLRGMAMPGVFPRGIYLSIIRGGRRYIHMTAGPANVSSSGTAALPIWPMLRFLTVDGDAVEIADPKIEGKLSGFAGAQWVSSRVDPLSFIIAERA